MSGKRDEKHGDDPNQKKTHRDRADNEKSSVEEKINRRGLADERRGQEIAEQTQKENVPSQREEISRR